MTMNGTISDDGSTPGHANGGSKGRWFIFVAAVLWSTSGLFAKAPVLSEWSFEDRGMLLAFWRALFAGMVLVPFLFPLSRRPGPSWWNWRLIPAGIFFAVMNFTFLKAMTLTTAANAIWLQYTAPVWVILIGVGLLGERSVFRDFVMVACALVGVAIIVSCEWNYGPDQARSRAGVVWSLAAGATLAGVMLSLRELKELPVVWTTAVCHFSAALMMAPLVLVQHGLPSPKLLGWMVMFGALQLSVPYLFFAKGLRTTTSHEASCIALLEPLFVPLWVYLCWRNDGEYRAPDWWTWLGGSVMLVGLLVRYWPHAARRTELPG